MNNNKLTRREALKAALAVGATVATSKALASESSIAPTTRSSTPHWGMVVDLRKCVGCQACTVACKIENNAPKGQFRTWVTDVEIKSHPHTKRVFTPRLCNHCDNPSCLPVCPTGATFKRADGVVLVDSERCWGCGSCVNACPYGARFINSETKIADKCTFCAHRLEQGLQPACAETCVGGARVFGDLNDANSPVSKLLKKHDVAVLKPTANTKPNVFYIGLNQQQIAHSEVAPNTWLLDFEHNIDDVEMSFKGAERG